jgi:dsRNA-specific ribonuclease
MILKEHGDHTGAKPKYTSETLSLEPPFYKVLVNLNGVTGEGRATTKKQAKHQASKDACQRLNFMDN